MARVTKQAYDSTVDQIEILLGQVAVINDITAKVNALETQRQTTIELAEKVLADGMESYAETLFNQVLVLEDQIYSLIDSADKQMRTVDNKFNAGFTADVDASYVLSVMYYQLQDSIDCAAQTIETLCNIQDYVRVA